LDTVTKCTTLNGTYNVCDCGYFEAVTFFPVGSHLGWVLVKPENLYEIMAIDINALEFSTACRLFCPAVCNFFRKFR
jgi:hypothetical protein